MRVIHTSDWHLGKSFGPVSLRGDQESFLDWFVELVVDQRAEMVVIAGDLYDRAIAPIEAIELFRYTARRLLSAGVVVAAITGNHDGPDRVAPYSDLLDVSGFYLRGSYDRVGEVISHQFPDGPLDLALIPFLDPQAAPDDFGADDNCGEDGEGNLLERRRRRDHESVLTTATELARASLVSPRSIAVAHAYVAGAKPSDSERQLVVGGTGEVPSTLFKGFSYVALGHLHRPQTAGSETVRYSGTPLAYSFSEDHPKSVEVIDLDGSGGVMMESIRVDVGRAVQTIQGEMSDLLDPTRFTEAHNKFVRAVVTDTGTVLDARARLLQVYPYVTEVQLKPAGRLPGTGEAPLTIRELEPIEAVRAFWEAAQGSAPSPQVDELLIAATATATASMSS